MGFLGSPGVSERSKGGGDRSPNEELVWKDPPFFGMENHQVGKINSLKTMERSTIFE